MSGASWFGTRPPRDDDVIVIRAGETVTRAAPRTRVTHDESHVRRALRVRDPREALRELRA